MWVDWLGECDLIVTQPMSIIFPQGRPRKHFPDILTRRLDGSVEIVNVAMSHKVDAKLGPVLPRLEAVAESLGWTTSVFTELPRERRSNIEWLYRFARPWPALVELFERQRSRITGPTSLRWVYRQDDPELTLAVWRGLWSRHFVFDVCEPLSDNTVFEPREEQ